MNRHVIEIVRYMNQVTHVVADLVRVSHGDTVVGSLHLPRKGGHYIEYSDNGLYKRAERDARYTASGVFCFVFYVEWSSSGSEAGEVRDAIDLSG